MVNRLRYCARPSERCVCYAIFWHEIIIVLDGYHRGLYVSRYKGRWGNYWEKVSVFTLKF